MRILNFDEFLRCQSTITETRRCSYTGGSGLPGVAYAGESGLTGVGCTGKSRPPIVAYTGDSRSLRITGEFSETLFSHWGVWTHRCRLHWQVRTPVVAYTGDSRSLVWPTQGSSQKLYSHTGESGLPVQATMVSMESLVWATPGSPDSLVQPTVVSYQFNLHGRPMLLKEHFLKKKTLSVKYWLLGRVSCIEKFSDLTHSDRLPEAA